MHITSAHVIGVGYQHYLYTNNFAHDANTTVTILHKYASRDACDGEPVEVSELKMA